MSLQAVAESALVEKLTLAREQSAFLKTNINEIVAKDSTNHLPPPPKLTDHEIENKQVMNLEIPQFDNTRKFAGIEKNKIAKKDRHMRELEKFSIDLEALSESIEQDVLTESRIVRETLEKSDEDIKTAYNNLENDVILLRQSSEELSQARDELIEMTRKRSYVIEGFGIKLENIEVNRAITVGGNIKKLVDCLIAIAHQLPDEIEHTVETETFELNTVLIRNRKSHAELISLLRTKQAEVEIIALHKWDVAKLRWRLLHHNHGLQIFHSDIQSPEYTEPSDRANFMSGVQSGQIERHNRRLDAIKDLSELNAENITFERCLEVHQKLVALNEMELSAGQSCYDGLSLLRVHARERSELRMENLRRELHVYGALHEEPELLDLANTLRKAIQTPELSELWRVGGGLKTEISAVVNDFTSPDVVYERGISHAEKKLELITSGFNLKEVLNERGRLPRLDAVRALLSKLRSAPRTDISGLLESLLSDLREMSLLEKMSAVFRSALSTCHDEMESEINRVKEENQSMHGSTLSASPSDLLGTRVGVGTVQSAEKTTNATVKNPSADLPGAASTKRGSIAVTLTAAASSTSLLTSGGSRTKRTAGHPEKIVSCPDPLLVKQWAKTLGILYYGSDIPSEYQLTCQNSLLAIKQQRVCNAKVDAVVAKECEDSLNRLDRKYRKVIDSVATFLENQGSSLYNCTMKLTEFFEKIAKHVETHKKNQLAIDEHSLDTLWDFKEEHRLKCEDREAEFNNACQSLRMSASPADVKLNFDLVIAKLAEILESYRKYHGMACFLADKHPLKISEDFVDHLNQLCLTFVMDIISPHMILAKHDSILSDFNRLNSRYIEEENLTKGPNSETVNDSDNGDAKGAAPTNDEQQHHTPHSGDTKSATYPEIFTLDPPEPDEFDDDAVPKVTENHPRTIPKKYGLHHSLLDFASSFFEESKDEDPQLSRPETGSDIHQPVSTNVVPSKESSASSAIVAPQISSQLYPWLTQWDDHASMDELKFSKMDQEDVLDFASRLEPSYITHNTFETDTTAKCTLSPQQVLQFEFCYSAIQKLKQHKLDMLNPSYLRNYIPSDSFGTPYVKFLAIEVEFIRDIISNIRHSLFVRLETNIEIRITDAKALNLKRKSELTEELEDLLRTHWPRSGLVETQIKRPREVELLNHEEKTYRFILSIQEKMSNLLLKFDKEVEGTFDTCRTYTEDMAALEHTLTTTPFKTLTSLQGLEVKARSFTQKLVSDTNALLHKLSLLTNEEPTVIMAFARDFRKICPPQEEGKEGGYSQSELKEIGELVEGQCKEIEEFVSEWKKTVESVKERIAYVLLDNDKFGKSYETVANDVALSQGLGQKFGAPRRRAQERIRTEVSRDEKSAGKIDEIIATLEFSCSEALTKHEEKVNDIKSGVNLKDEGRMELQCVDDMWKLAIDLRSALHERAEYLEVFGEDADKILSVISWPAIKERFPPLENTSDATNSLINMEMDGNMSPRKIATETLSLAKVMGEVDAVCRQETKQLYEIEKKSHLLAGMEGGVPESLQTWLKESHHKVLGPGGHREKAWKRLWDQIDKFESLLARKTGPLDQPQIKVGVPASSFRNFSLSYVMFTGTLVSKKVDQFSKLLKLWEKGREKHERQLRPRLGSPDALPELLALDAIETERSNELKSSVLKFQSNLIMLLVQYSKSFCEDLGICAKDYILMLDSSLHLELVQVPPDTEVVKRKITMKRLRKAQRIKDEVKSGKEDNSVERVWPPLQIADLIGELKKAEPLVLPSDLSILNPVQEPPPVAAVAPTKALPKLKKGENIEAAPAAPPAPPPLIPDGWINKLKEESAVRGQVTSAHRLVINERDAALNEFTNHIRALLQGNKEYYGNILQQEDSWHARWESQIGMLKEGKL